MLRESEFTEKATTVCLLENGEKRNRDLYITDH
jgi:hypothetical protein